MSKIVMHGHLEFSYDLSYVYFPGNGYVAASAAVGAAVGGFVGGFIGGVLLTAVIAVVVAGAIFYRAKKKVTDKTE